REFIVDYRPGAGVRISPHFYTKDEELDLVISEMRKIRETLGYATEEKVGASFRTGMDRIKLFTESQNFLRTIVSEAEKNNEAARQLVNGLTEAQLNWKPDAKRWSIAQCL